MKAFPVKFEIVDEASGAQVGKVSMFDESWRTFSAQVESLLVRQMDMEVTGQ